MGSSHPHPTGCRYRESPQPARDRESDSYFLRVSSVTRLIRREPAETVYLLKNEATVPPLRRDHRRPPRRRRRTRFRSSHPQRSPSLEQAPLVDGIISDDEWRGVAVLDTPFIQFEPETRSALLLPDRGPDRSDRDGALCRHRGLRPESRTSCGGRHPARRLDEQRRLGGGDVRHLFRQPHRLRLLDQRPRDPVGRPDRGQRPHRRQALGRRVEVRGPTIRRSLDGGVRDSVRGSEVSLRERTAAGV